MSTTRPHTLPHKGRDVERRVLICEVCGERLETDMESGEQHCPVCETTEE